MNCKRVKDIIMDYIDGELDKRLENELKEHLGSCRDCRAFEESLRRKVVEPLKNTERIKAPDEIWQRVKEKIEYKEQLRPAFYVRKPVLVLATALSVVLIVVALTRQPLSTQEAVNAYIEEEVDFLSNMEVDFNTDIEAYLL